MRISSCLRFLAVAAACAVPVVAAAHTGGALDADGCHADHRDGSYHCHRGEAAGRSFTSRAAMLEAVRTGRLPDKTVDEEGFFSRLWPFGNDYEQEESSPDASTAATGAEAARADVPPKQREAEEKLKVLKGLYEMGLISKEEYEQKRKAVLDEL